MKAETVVKIVDDIFKAILASMLSCAIFFIITVPIVQAPTMSRLDNAFIVGLCALSGASAVLMAIKIEAGRLVDRS